MVLVIFHVSFKQHISQTLELMVFINSVSLVSDSRMCCGSQKDEQNGSIYFSVTDWCHSSSVSNRLTDEFIVRRGCKHCVLWVFCCPDRQGCRSENLPIPKKTMCLEIIIYVIILTAAQVHELPFVFLFIQTGFDVTTERNKVLSLMKLAVTYARLEQRTNVWMCSRFF